MIFWEAISLELEDQEMNLKKRVNRHTHNTKQLLGCIQVPSTYMLAKQ